MKENSGQHGGCHCCHQSPHIRLHLHSRHNKITNFTPCRTKNFDIFIILPSQPSLSQRLPRHSFNTQFVPANVTETIGPNRLMLVPLFSTTYSRNHNVRLSNPFWDTLPSARPRLLSCFVYLRYQNTSRSFHTIKTISSECCTSNT